MSLHRLSRRILLLVVSLEVNSLWAAAPPEKWEADLIQVRDYPMREEARTALSPGPVRVNYLWSVDLLVSLRTTDNTETLLELESTPFLSGQHLEFNSGADIRTRVILEPVIGPDGNTFQFGVGTTIDAPGGSLKKDLTKMLDRSKPLEVALGMLGDATVMLRLILHLDLDYFGPPALETPAKKTAAIEEIRKSPSQKDRR